MPESVRHLRSYGRLDEATVLVRTPDDVPELATMLTRARDDGRRVTVRGGGWSFHDQSLNTDLVISLERLNAIHVDRATQTVDVGPGATWGDILDACLAEQLVPYVLVTGNGCTAGGTLATDGICRHSPSYGSESVHVASFELLTVGATVPVRYDQPDPDATDRDAQIYRAVIGGFGYLGVVTSIRYRLLDARDFMVRGPLQIATTLKAVESFAELVDTQLEWTHAARVDFSRDLEHRDFETYVTDADPAVYGVAFFRGGDGKGAVYRSTYTSNEQEEPYIVFDRNDPLRIATGLAAAFDLPSRIGKAFFWQQLRSDSKKKRRFVNGVRDWHFFQDANVTKKELGEKLGFKMPVIQQTFVIPTGNTADFLDEMPEICRDQHDQLPTLLDVLYMPADHILMSASYEVEGFACTLAFEDIRDIDKRDAVIAAMHDLSDLSLSMGGRVHYTKNVYTSAETLAAMYGQNLTAFLALEAELDPTGVLRNGFFDRCFAQPGVLVP